MSAARKLERDLAEGRVVLVDGGMGTEIEARGVTMDDAAWCALANLDDLDVVQEIHEDYIRAGADVIITNTFPAGRTVLADGGHENEFEQINRRAVTAALRARASTGTETLIAGAVGGLPTASDMTFHDRGLSPEQLFRAFNEQAMLLADAGVDLIALEMIGPGGHAQPAVRAALATGLPVWLGLSVLRLVGTETDYGDLADPDDRSDFEALVSNLADSRPAAITVMHSSLEQVEPALELVRAHWQEPIGVYPHVGTFVAPTWHFEDITPEEFAAHARGWVEHGARLIGGCCGIRPAHIAALKRSLSGAGSGSDDAARYSPSA